MSRATLWRILDDADLKPHRSVYWLNSHDPDFDTKARHICDLYVNAFRLYQEGRLVLCVDEKTGMQILQRKYPTQLAQPGQPEKREHEYIRHGVRALLASFVVPTGHVLWTCGLTRTSDDFAAHLRAVVAQLPTMARYDWILDNLNTHWSLEVCRLVASWCDVPFVAKELACGVQRRAFLSDPTHRHVFHFTPTHGSWLNQVELWFSVFARRFLKRGDFCSGEDFESTTVCLPGGLQYPRGPPLSLDVHGTAVSACHAVQSDPPPTTAGTGLVQSAPAALCPSLVSPSPL